MNLTDAQKDMRISYLAGGPGILTSGIVWLITGILSFYLSKQASVLIFFLGGMIIHPMGVMISKFFKRSGKHQADNPLAKLAIETLAILFIGIFIAYCIFQVKANWFFPIMLMIIGVRYLLFQSIYGIKLYWILGGALTVAGVICLIANQAFQIAPIIGGVIELLFAGIIIKKEVS